MGTRSRLWMGLVTVGVCMTTACCSYAVGSWTHRGTGEMAGSVRDVELVGDDGRALDHGRILVLTVHEQTNMESLTGDQLWSSSNGRRDVADDARFETSDTLRAAEDAWVAAAELLGEVVEYSVYGDVLSVWGPAERAGILPGDRVLTMNGRALSPADGEDGHGVLWIPAETTALLGVLRGGQLLEVPVSVSVSSYSSGNPLVAGEDGNLLAAGVSLDLHAAVHSPRPRVGVPSNEHGPSSGLPHALAMVDVLFPGEVTGGRIVAATGVVDRFGNVHPVSEAATKTHAAIDAGAAVVLVPARNLDEALTAAAGRIEVIGVSSLAEAVHSLCQHFGPTGACAVDG